MTVADTGSGIPEQELPRVFERFHRVEGTKGRSFEGSGIGLALVQELVKLHGGTVTVSSKVDAGSTFTVAVPRGKAHLPAERIDASRNTHTALRAESYVEEGLRWLPDDKLQDRDGAAAPEGSLGAVVLADDNADMRAYVEKLLREQYTVFVAGNGEQALELVQRHRPDLVLTDVMMPGMDGFELLRDSVAERYCGTRR